jgi:putative ATPase
MNEDLFARPGQAYQPLAARMRPQTLVQYLGQDHILGPGKPLRVALEQGHLHSMILWGPPGVGKTSLARLITGQMEAVFVPLSAVFSGVKDIRAAVADAEAERKRSGRRMHFCPTLRMAP